MMIAREKKNINYGQYTQLHAQLTWDLEEESKGGNHDGSEGRDV